MDKRFIMTSSPHVRSEDSTRSIMLDVLIAMLPALVLSVYTFGARAFMLTIVAVCSCVLFEYLYCRLIKRPQPVGDLSAAVTGVLLAYNLPVAVPIWIPVIGSFFAIVIVKQLYGGIGKNVFNPALAARVFLFLSWPVHMSNFTAPHSAMPLLSRVDAVVTATPMGIVKAGGAISGINLMDMLLGNTGGCIGETSALALIAGGVYLVARRVISPRIPLTYLASVAIVSVLSPGAGLDNLTWMGLQLLGGGLMLGAIFMATDYTTSPVTIGGQYVYGIGCGLLTIFIRYFGAYSEGVSFSILIMNALVWAIDMAFKPPRYGTKRFEKIENYFKAKSKKKDGESS
ncbi:MAG: RnfABCDGE type electron transport complex subunit D [Clostridiales bacterium]|nr:RnfABCDGE type electron transport complex subunit D [Clostridiales bacterium]